MFKLGHGRYAWAQASFCQTTIVHSPSITCMFVKTTLLPLWVPITLPTHHRSSFNSSSDLATEVSLIRPSFYGGLVLISVLIAKFIKASLYWPQCSQTYSSNLVLPNYEGWKLSLKSYFQIVLFDDKLSSVQSTCRYFDYQPLNR